MSALAPGSRGYIRAIVGAQMLAQLGAFALPALLPSYIDRWSLSKTEAGWLPRHLFSAAMGGVAGCGRARRTAPGPTPPKGGRKRPRGDPPPPVSGATGGRRDAADD